MSDAKGEKENRSDYEICGIRVFGRREFTLENSPTHHLYSCQWVAAYLTQYRYVINEIVIG